MTDEYEKSDKRAHPKNRKQAEKLLRIPSWVLKAEQDYLTRRVPSYRALCQKYSKSASDVTDWGRKRDWQRRKKEIEAKAATVIADEVDEEAVQQLADAFQSIEGDVIKAGQMAARIAAIYMQGQLEKMVNARQHKRAYSPVAPGRDFIHWVKLAVDMRPKKAEDVGEFESLADLLNPSDDDDKQAMEDEMAAIDEENRTAFDDVDEDEDDAEQDTDPEE